MVVGVWDPRREVGLEVRSVAVPEGLELARRENDDAFVEERERVPLREKNRRVDEERFGGAKLTGGDDKGGELGPRSSLSRFIAVVQRVQGCVWGWA